jgi:uncharacterized protein (DUF2252 family)
MSNHFKAKNKRLYKEGIKKGRSLREQATLESHSGFSVNEHREVACELIEGQNESRIQRLVPYRRGGMLVSPFTFYRGAARIMAFDFRDTPVSGLNAQICGDAHLGNFGVYASPERQLIYDLNDFDETLPGPWEWDVKRLAASFAIAGFYSKLPEKDIKSICSFVTRSYRESMRKISKMLATDIWYSLVAFENLDKKIDKNKGKKKFEKFTNKAKSKDHFHVFHKLTEVIDDMVNIIHDPPFIVPTKILKKDHDEQDVFNFIKDQYEQYQKSVSDHTLMFLSDFQLMDAALKVVGVGSIGTSCHIILLEHKTKTDPFFLQIKQAQTSVLEEFLPASHYDHPGRRVVEGQRLMQTVSDPFLGWSTGNITGNHYYWRQLKDWKGSIELENLSFRKLQHMARLRGFTLAKAHARTVDPIIISGYLGKSKKFDDAIAAFSMDYARQNESDYQTYKDYIRDHQLPMELHS